MARRRAALRRAAAGAGVSASWGMASTATVGLTESGTLKNLPVSSRSKHIKYS